MAIAYKESPFTTVYVVSSFDGTVPFTCNTWPILKFVEVILFKLIKSCTVTLNFCAILYSESPFTTVYVVWLSFSVLDDGVFKTCPTLKLLLVRLFKDFSSATEVFNFLAIDHNESPFCTT